MKNLARTALGTLVATAIIVAAPGFAFAAGNVPTPHPDAPGVVKDKVNTLLDLLMWIGGAAVVGGIILAGILMAVGHDGGRGGREGMSKLWFVAGGAVVIGCCSTLAGWLL